MKLRIITKKYKVDLAKQFPTKLILQAKLFAETIRKRES